MDENEFNALWDSVPAAAEQSSEAPTFDELWETTPAAGEVGHIEGGASQLGKGLTFGFFDELQGAEAGFHALLRNLFNLEGEKAVGEAYNRKVEEARGLDARYEESNPKTALALQIAGSIAPSVVGAGGGRALGGLESLLSKLFVPASETIGASRPAANLLMRELFGVGVENAPTMKSLARLGFVGGAATGAGESEGGGIERVKGAIKGGAIGAVAAPVVGKVVEKSLGGVSNLLSNTFQEAPEIDAAGRLVERAIDPLAGQRGMVRLGGEGFAPEEIYLAKQLKNTPLEKVAAAADELDRTIGENVPLFTPEALRSPKVDRNARHIANQEGSIEFARTRIDDRTADASQRATELFDVVSPDRGAFTGASKLVKGAEEILTAAEERRQALVQPLYGKAYQEQPLVSSPLLAELLEKDAALNQAIKRVQKTANNADLPVNSTQLLVKARQELSNMIDAAKAKGYGREVRDLGDTYQRLNDILHGNQYLAAADSAYAAASAEIEALNDTFLKNLSSLSDDKVQNVSRIFQLPTERIAELRGAFAAAGKLDQWNAGIRSHMQNVVESTKPGRNFTDAISGTTIQKAKLKAALGESYDRVVAGLDLENRMFIGKNTYHPGSSTAGNLEEQAEFRKAAGAIRSFLNRDYGTLLESFLGTGMSEELAQAMAEIYFDPKRGRDALRRVLPLLESYARNQAVSESAGIGSAEATSRLGSVGASEASDRSLGLGLADPTIEPRKPRTPQSSTPEPTPHRLSSSGNSQGQEKGGIRFPDQKERPLSTAEGGYRRSAGSAQTAREVRPKSLRESGELSVPAEPAQAAQPQPSQSSQGAESSSLSYLDRTSAGSSDQESSIRSLMANLFGPSEGGVIPALFGSASVASATERPASKPDVAAVEAQIDADPFDSAVYETESSRNPNAKNPESSAKGGFQFVNATAKALGLKDPFNLGESYSAFQKLKAQHQRQFGEDPRLLYAAHFLGAPTLAKVLERKKLTAAERQNLEAFESEALPRFLRIYNRIASQGIAA